MKEEKYIETATAHFKELLKSQIARAQNIEHNSAVTDFAQKKQIKIGLCSGDGIGPIIINSAKKILTVLLKKELQENKIIFEEINGLTIENRIKQGASVPEDVLIQIKSCDVFLKGPTTTPDTQYYGKNIESANVTLRRELDLFANVRPIKIPSKNIDWVFFRENTEGEYALGSQGIDIDDILAMDFKVTTNSGTRRIARAAFEYAKQNGKKNVTIVTKANILKKTDGKFLDICSEIAKEYPEINTTHKYIDIMCANLIDKNTRDKFEVFVLPNLYGDIITDEAAQIQGGVGTAGSANIGSRYAMFEAIHGSAPQMIIDGLLEYVNSESILRASEMMLRHIGFTDYANTLDFALNECKIIVDGTKNGATTQEFTEEIINIINTKLM